MTQALVVRNYNKAYERLLHNVYPYSNAKKI